MFSENEVVLSLFVSYGRTFLKYLNIPSFCWVAPLFLLNRNLLGRVLFKF